MNIDAFPKTYQRKSTAQKRRTQYQSYFSPSSPVIHGYSKVFSGAESQYQEDGVLADCPCSTSSKARPHARKNCPCSTSSKARPHARKNSPCSTSSKARPHARKGHKRKTKAKEEQIDSEETIPQRTHFRGQVRRKCNNSSVITIERGKLDSATFLHYFTHIWSAFPEEKLKSVMYLDPLLFELYSKEKNRSMVLKWIKEKGVFSKKYVFVPIVMWSHWSLLIFCHFGETHLHSKTKGPCMLLLDSLHAIGPTRLEPLIRRLLFDIYKSEERLESKEQLKKMPLLIPKVPQQKKGEECGFYILYFMKLFLETAPENLNISEGYPQFMKEDWFTVEEVESFCKSLDALPLVLSDHGDLGPADSNDSVEFIESLCDMEQGAEANLVAGGDESRPQLVYHRRR